MFTPETIALVKDRTDIVAVVTEAVPSLKKKGRTFVGLCPFHKEKTPSFHVNPDKGFFHCFGCGESGSAIDFVMRTDGYTFPEAIRALAERAGIPVEETTSREKISESDRQKKAKEDLYAVNALAATFFEEQLRKHEHRAYALEELAKRGLEPGKDSKIDDALQAFRIGYAPAGWDALAQFLKAQGVSPVTAETVGLLVPRSSGSGYYDRFRHRLMFAVVDPQGRVVAFSGRALRDLPNASADGDKGGPPPKYINSPESPVYTKGNMLFGIHQARHAIRQAEEAILVEGNFDVMSLHARGLENVVAPLGTAFTSEQAKLLKRFASNVVFLFDGDAAGRKAVRVSRDAIRAAGIDARVAELPDGVDPDELAKNKGIDAVKDLVASAKGMLEALIEMALDESFNQADAHEKQSRLAYVGRLIAEENDPVVQAMLKGFTDMIAGRLDIVRSGPGAFAAVERAVREQVHAEKRKIEEQVREARAKAYAPAQPPPPPAVSNGRHIAAKTPGAPERKAIVDALVEWPVLLDDPVVEEELTLLEGNSVMIVAALRRSLRDRAVASPLLVTEQAGVPPETTKVLDTEAFLAQVPEAARPFVSERLANPLLEDAKAAKEYLLANAKKLKRLLLSQEAAQIARETYRAQGDWQTESELLREAAERVKTKHGIKT